MKLTLEIYDTAKGLAERCRKEKCPIGLSTPIACPICKSCPDVTPEDWKKLEVKDEDV